MARTHDAYQPCARQKTPCHLQTTRPLLSEVAHFASPCCTLAAPPTLGLGGASPGCTASVQKRASPYGASRTGLHTASTLSGARAAPPDRVTDGVSTGHDPLPRRARCARIEMVLSGCGHSSSVMVSRTQLAFGLTLVLVVGCGGETSGGGRVTGASSGVSDGAAPSPESSACVMGGGTCVVCSDGNWHCGGTSFPQCDSTPQVGSACGAGASCVICATDGLATEFACVNRSRGPGPLQWESWALMPCQP